MRFLLMIYQAANWSEVPNDEKNRIHEACGAWHEDLVRNGISHAAYALQPPATATTLRGSSSNLMVTDGPFIETKEVLGGFEVIDCPDRDAALAVAKQFPGLRSGHCRIELRPLVEGGSCRD